MLKRRFLAAAIDFPLISGIWSVFFFIGGLVFDYLIQNTLAESQLKNDVRATGIYTLLAWAILACQILFPVVLLIARDKILPGYRKNGICLQRMDQMPITVLQRVIKTGIIMMLYNTLFIIIMVMLTVYLPKNLIIEILKNTPILMLVSFAVVNVALYSTILLFVFLDQMIGIYLPNQVARIQIADCNTTP